MFFSENLDIQITRNDPKKCLQRFFNPASPTYKHQAWYVQRSYQMYKNSIYFSVTSIACFKCVSVGKDNPSCEDPFHNNMTRGEVTLEQPCMGGRKGRDGLFPASDCIKVTGNYGNVWSPAKIN